MGVLVVLNDEIHAAREVTKTSTLRLQTFRTPDFGVLGHADGDAVAFYRRPLRRCAPDTEFDIRASGRRCRGSILRMPMPAATAPRCARSLRRARRGSCRRGSRRAFAPPGDFEALKEAVGAGRGGGAEHARRVGADVPQYAAARGGDS